VSYRNYRKFVIILALIICLVYVPYRAVFTLNTTTPYALFASLFLLIGECFAIMSLLLYFVQVWDVRDPPEQPVLEGRTVDVLIPTLNEDVHLLRATLQACARMDYPHRTYVLDDGRRPEVEALARELGAGYVSRPDNRHAKAGNLNHALERTDGEFVVILDADHVPEPNFISRIIGYFADERLGYVQTPHAFYNFDSFQARLNHKQRYYWEESEVSGAARSSPAVRPCSAARPWKTSATSPPKPSTEDLHTGLRINAKGWKSLAIRERLIAGQAAPDITTFHSQRLRWATGNLSIMAYDNPLTVSGLTLPQRLCYFGSMIHWSSGFFKLAIYLTPLLMLFTGVPPVAKFTWTLGIITAFYLVIALYALKVVTNGYGSFLNWEFFSMMGFWVQIRATLRALFVRRGQEFVVTSKRGRQAKQVWPYVIPHACLIGLTILALVWAWGRVAVGISDDFYKPIVASLWAVFHLSLACLVVRRILWPDNRRFAYRHLVNLPVAYELPQNGTQAPRRLGLTVDLSDTGLSLVAYEPLPVDTRLRLLVHGGGETIEGQGRIRWRKELAHTGRNGSRRPGGFRYGVTLDLTTEQADVLQRVALQYAVPRLYEEYGSGQARGLWQRLWEQIVPGHSERRSERRFAHRLPLILNPDGPPEAACYTVTEDLNRQTVSALLDTALAPGAESDFLMGTPLGQVRGRAELVRERPRRLGSRTYHYCVFRLPHFEEQGRDTVRTLVNPPEHRHLDPLLSPDKEPLRVPLVRPLIVGLCVLLPFLLLEAGVFNRTHQDDFFLRDMAALQGRNADDKEKQEIDRIYQETIKERYPGTDRIVLLQGALHQIGRQNEIDHLTELLAPRDRNNMDLQVALVHALDNLQEYTKAEEEYQKVLELNGRVPMERKQELLLAAARSAVHAGRLDTAIERFQVILQQHAGKDDEEKLRNEYASVLISARRLAEVMRLYEGREPDYDGHWLLVYAHILANDYDDAEKECRAILRLRPNDRQAELLLADVLSFKKGFAQSRAIYDRLLKSNGNDPKIQLRLANIILWSQNYNEALPLFQGLLETGHRQPEVIRGFVDAASSAEKIDPAQKKLALGIFDATITAPDGDPVFLSRLAWVLQRAREADKSAALLARALDLAPKNRTLRHQYVGSLIEAGQVKEAGQVLEGDEQDLQTRELRIHVYLKSKNFKAAEEECRVVLQARPNDLKMQRLLADILSWKGSYEESLALLDQLLQADPNNRELAVRRAEVTLWSRDYSRALARFQALLDGSLQQPDLWRGYVQAAAGVEHLTPVQQALVTRIARQPEVRDTKDPVFLARLGWVLSRIKEPALAASFLERAVASRPTEPEARKELAGVLAGTGQYKQALQLYQGLTLDLEDQYRLVGLYAADQDFTGAERECRAILQKHADDKRARRMLADVLSWKRDFKGALKILEELAQADPTNAELATRLAEVTLWSGDYPRALARYQALLENAIDRPELWRGFVDCAAHNGPLTPARARLVLRVAERKEARESKDPLLLGRLALLLHRLNEPDKAAYFLNRVASLRPADPAARKELAGILAGAGRPQMALEMYEGLTLEVEDHYRLATIYSAAKDFAGAEKECQVILQEKPADERALRLLADVLSWKKDYKRSLELLEQLAQAHPKDAELPLRLAEVTLWSGDHARALARFQALLEANFDRPELWNGFVGAAAATESLTAAQLQTLLRIAALPQAKESRDGLFLGRLGWVLRRLKQFGPADALLTQAGALVPADPQARRELAGILAAAGKNRLALSLYEGLALTREDRYRLVGLYSADQDFANAEKQCREILHEAPDDPRGLRLLADVLSWRRDFRGSLAIYEGLAKADPKDTELARRLAEVTLWSGDYARALGRYQVMLETSFHQPELWTGFINAAAGADHLSAAQTRLAVRIAEQKEVEGSTNPLFLARLSWVLHRARQPKLASTFFDKAVALQSPDPAVRRELAGALAAAGKTKQALALYEGLRLTDKDRFRMAYILAAEKDFDGAEKLCRAILESAPDDTAAQQLLADVLSWNQKYDEAATLYQKLLQANPEDSTLPVKLAQVALWSHDYDTALDRYSHLLEKDPARSELWTGYLDAAASASSLGSGQKELVLHIYEKDTENHKPAVYQSRLAWVLRRLKESEKALEVLNRALAAELGSRALRLQVAETLYELQRYDEAEGQFRILLESAGQR
jgi:cellulose synthase/poly-beta-1,6-N-acetylglucosamine synthase-like glycosyltransferase/predicted Zn-dependent protease